VGVYLKASLVTLVMAIVLFLGFRAWREQSQTSVATDSVTRLDKMETEGVPAFELNDMNGQLVNLDQFKGKAVILSFWASWCGPCLEEFPSMIQLVKEMKGEVQLVAVSQDSSREDIEAFLKSFPESKDSSIHILWDEGHKVGELYGTDRLPESYVLGKDMKLVRKIVGSINWSSPDAVDFMKDLVKK